MACKADVYFLADNTGSMGSEIESIRAVAESMFAAFSASHINFAYGVGNYQDFPIPVTRIWYGGGFLDSPDNIAVTAGVGATVTVPYGQGPIDSTIDWPGPTASVMSPVDHITLPFTTIDHDTRYTINSQLTFSSTGTVGNITARIMSNLFGEVRSITFSPSLSEWPTFSFDHFHDGTAGEEISVTIENNLDAPVDVTWNSLIRGSYADNISAGPYGFWNQQAITTDVTETISSLNEWVAYDGGDTPESWLYAMWRIARDTGGEIGWRHGAKRFILVFGDAPSHAPIPAALTGESVDVDEASATAALVDNKVTVLAVSIDSGMDDSVSSGYPGYSNTATPGEITRVTTATAGHLLDVSDPSTIGVVIQDLILEFAKCRPGMAHIQIIGG